MKGRNLDSRDCMLQWPSDCGIYAVCTRTNLFEIRFVVFQVKHVDGWACSSWRSAHAVSVKTVSGTLQTVSDRQERVVME